MDRLEDYRTKSREDWFIETLDQTEFYRDKYEVLVERVRQYSWVGEAPDLLNPSFANILKITPRDAWNHFISVFCAIDEHQHIELLSIFELLKRDPEPTRGSQES